MSLSIRWRLTVGIAVALILTLTVIFVTLRLSLSSTLRSQIDDDLAHDSGHISAQIALLRSRDDVQLQRIVDTYSAGGLSSSFGVVIRDVNGRVLAATGGVDADQLTLSAGDLPAVLGGSIDSRDVDLGAEGEVRARTSRLVLGHDVVGIVQVARSTDLINRPLEQLQTILVAAGIGGVILAAFLGYWVARATVRPLQDVVAVAAEIEASDLSRRIRARRKPGEVQQLADTFDAMLQRLEEAFLQQRNFVMDMSHELRTPLAALRGNMDVLLMDEELEAEIRSQLERMSREVARLIRLTSNLLYIAHADAGRAVEKRPVELDVLCLEVYRQAKDLRPEVRFRLGHEDQAAVVGDRDLLKQLVLNLVDNALKFTAAGGDVTLSLYRDESEARIVVQDTGPGISAEQIPSIFKRLYRAENGRRGAGGAGLGLAISDWIAKAHGGEIVVESEVGKGSVFTVRLPMGAARSTADEQLAEPGEARPASSA